MIICPNCGAELPDGSKFCTSCGTQINSQTAQTNYNQQAHQQAYRQFYQQPYRQQTYQQPYQNTFGLGVPPEYEPLSPWGYIGYSILMSLSIIGLIL